jgi:MYXO-CTERM domain-containing protein
MSIRYIAICLLACFIIIFVGSPVRAVLAQGTDKQPPNVDPTKPVTFSWYPYKETTKYRFVLASDAEMNQIIVEADVAGTDYVYNGTLDYDTNYFWRVMAVEPAPSDWSATFAFRTQAKPVPPAPANPQPGISCAKANASSPSPTSDISPFLLGALLLGLVFAGRRRPGK